MPTVGDDVGQFFQGTVHISKYGKHGYAKWKKESTIKCGKVTATKGDGAVSSP